MANDFQHDVFLSHSSKDKAVVCVVAERMTSENSHKPRGLKQRRPVELLSCPLLAETCCDKMLT